MQLTNLPAIQITSYSTRMTKQNNLVKMIYSESPTHMKRIIHKMKRAWQHA